ncbi:VOC family protein [Microbacterium sp. 4R-513]|uniref:VOC family protein n=1 Tax=Microbacterium sp. 4R-513 TaxID=2567934 RepID=UPI003219B9A8
MVDPARALRRAVDLFAPEVPREQGTGDEPLVGVRAPDGSELFFGASASTEPRWVQEFGAAESDTDVAVECVDHVNMAQPWQHFDAAVLFFQSVLDLRTEASVEVAAPIGLVRSQALHTEGDVLRVALNLVPSGAREDDILPQHIAFATQDILALARAARARGFRPLPIPANYYDDVQARFRLEPGLLDQLRELDVMYDRDESGEFLHFYTEPVGTVFLEVVERRDGYTGYGAVNAPVRLAAQHQYRRAASKGSGA